MSISTLSEIVESWVGLIQAGPFGSQLHQHDYSEQGIPVVMPKDIRTAADSVAGAGGAAALQGMVRPLYDISKIDFDRLRQEFERSPAKRTTMQNLKTAIEQRLQRLLQQNPLRTDFQRHYEEIVAEYNREKDRVTIEKTFEALLQIMDEMDDEESRAVREGLDEESLAVFDLLRKPDLTSSDIKRIKAVAVDLPETLKAEKLRINHWRDKESTRDAVRLTIQDYLWSEQTGLPETYSEEDVRDKTEAVFVHVFRAYPTMPSPYYASMAS